MDFLSGLGSVIGIIGGLNQQSAASSSMRQALEIQLEQLAKREKLAEALQGVYQQVQGIVKGAKAKGYFDPEGRVQQLRTSVSQNLARQTDNLASSAKVMGYRPGDTVPQQEIAMADSNAARNLATAEQQARRQAFEDELSATTFGTNLLGEASNIIGGSGEQAGQALQQNAAYHSSQVPDFSGFLASLGSYFDQNKKSGSNPGYTPDFTTPALPYSQYAPNYEFNLGDPRK